MTSCMEVANDTPSATTTLNFLSAHGGWHAKADILAIHSTADRQWNATNVSLIANGRVERHCGKRGTRHQAVSSGEEK